MPVSARKRLQHASAVPKRQPELVASMGMRPLCHPSGGFGHLKRLARLTIGPVDDVHEREADRVADQVMRMQDPAEVDAPQAAGSYPGVIQRPWSSCEEAMQPRASTRSGETVEVAPDSVTSVLRSSGQALDEATRAYFEPRFGVAFGAVRVHTDAPAATSARAVNAVAYAVGPDVVFDTGRYLPHTSAGRRLLAHELTHVVQQSGGAAMARRQHKERSKKPRLSKVPENPSHASFIVGWHSHRVLVFVPPSFIEQSPTDVDVMIFFHGLGGDYRSRSVDNIKHDNAAIAADLPGVARTSGRVVLAPEIGTDAAWQSVDAGGYKTMVDAVLSDPIGGSHGLKQPLVKHISLVGHSAGGKALGQAARDFGDGAQDITIQDGGYGRFFSKKTKKVETSGNYTKSWDALREWMTSGAPGKVVRVITRNRAGSGDEASSSRYVVENADHGLGAGPLSAWLGQHRPDLEVALGGAGPSSDGGDIRLEFSVTVKRRADAMDRPGVVQATVYVFVMKGDHFDTRNRTMGAAAASGATKAGGPAGGEFVKRVPGLQRRASSPAPLVPLPAISPAAVQIQRVQLTYDDGPDRAGNTHAVLTALDAAGARATFYLVGKRVAQGDNWRVVFDIAAAGHWLGNHAYDWNDATDNHTFLSGTAEERATKILQTEWAIRDALIQGSNEARKSKAWDSIPTANRGYIEDVIAHGTGRFRTPGFKSKPWSKDGTATLAAIASANRVLAATGLRPLAFTELSKWGPDYEGVTVDPKDWQSGRTQSDVESAVTGGLSSNADSILLHSRLEASAKATPAILLDIKNRQWTFDPTIQGGLGSQTPKPPFADLSTISNPPTSGEIARARSWLRRGMLSFGPYVCAAVALGIFQMAQRAGSAEVSAFAAEIKATNISTSEGEIPMANWMNANPEWRLFANFFENWMTNKPFPRIKGVTT